MIFDFDIKVFLKLHFGIFFYYEMILCANFIILESVKA